MKRILVAAVGIILVIALFSGCSSKGSTAGGAGSGGNAPVSYQGDSTNTSVSSSTVASAPGSSQAKLTINTVKGMSDEQLIENATKGQQQLNIDDVQNSITTSDLDQLLSNNDPLSDIPSK